MSLGRLAEQIAVLEVPPPPMKAPKDRPERSLESEDLTPERFAAALETHVLGISSDSGCADLWKSEKGYSGEFFYYRRVTGSFYDVSLEDALETATDWYERCHGWDWDDDEDD